MYLVVAGILQALLYLVLSISRSHDLLSISIRVLGFSSNSFLNRSAA
jgi:hypothetical protein